MKLLSYQRVLHQNIKKKHIVKITSSLLLTNASAYPGCFRAMNSAKSIFNQRTVKQNNDLDLLAIF